MFFALVAGRYPATLGYRRAGLSYPVYANTHTHTHTHTHECYTHTHERGWADAEGEQDTERGPLGASAKATATRRKDQKMKVGGRRFEFRRGMHSTARRSTTTTTSHLRGPIYIRLTSRRDRETTRAVANQRGTRGVSRGTVFFTARDDAFDSRDTFKDADGPSKGFVGDTHTRTHMHGTSRSSFIDRPLLQLSTSGDAARVRALIAIARLTVIVKR